MSWRTNTLAEKPGHRHEESQWPQEWKPSDGFIEPAPGWGLFAFYVLAGLCVACAVAWGIKELLQ